MIIDMIKPQISSRSTNYFIIFFGGGGGGGRLKIFVGIVLRLETCPNPCLSWPPFATGDQETVSMPKYSLRLGVIRA